MIIITSKENCTGCQACYNACPKNCINMYLDQEGFLYPSVDIDNCIKCDLCEKVCPIINAKDINNTPKTIACYNKDEKIRYNSSSGGIFTLIAEQIIKSGGVVFGASFDNDYNVKHICVDNIHDLEKLRGSKYVQSTIGNTFFDAKNFLNKDRKVLFTGTPCQISALKRYLNKEYDNLICQDIVCHGVPSIFVWEHYKKSISEISGNNKLVNIKFREKSCGWKNYSLKFDFEDGNSYKVVSNQSSYIKGFVNDFYLRPSCYKCKYKSLHRESDITLADFWGIESVAPELDDDKGTSLVFINSTKGNQIFDKIKFDIVYKFVEIDEAVRFNPSAFKSAKYTKKRKVFFRKYENEIFDILINDLLKESSLEKIYKYINEFKRKVKRVFYKIRSIVNK